MADIVGSTQLAQTVPADELPVIIGRWLAECKQTIEEHGGNINQYLGDGFFAFWFERERTEIAVDGAVQALKRLQLQAQPAFRVVVHFGQVVTGGESLGEESLIGREVHFVFRMEKLAGSLKELRLLSEAAWSRLAALVEARDIGQHALAGFELKYPFYTY